MKKNIIFVIMSLFVILMVPNDVLAGAEGLCPLPKEYKVEMDGTVKENADPGCAMGLSVRQATVPDGGNVSTQTASFIVNEDESHNYAFKAFPGGVMPSQISGNDSSTKSDYLKWMPKESTYHDHERDLSPSGRQMSSFPMCYNWKGITTDGVKWVGDYGWKVKNVYHAYHMDSPTKYGDCGCIGYNVNPGESTGDGGADGKSEFSFAYAEPSVPLWFAASSVLSITWDWEGKYVHGWTIRHIDVTGGPYGPDGLCDFCHISMTAEMNGPYDTTPKECAPKVENWPPSKFYDNNNIQDSSVAIARKGSALYFDAGGVPSNIYSTPDANFGLPNEPVVVARATVRVKDKSNVAHVQVGVEGANTNVLQAECGKKISQSGDKTMIIRIVDNAVHATKATVVDSGEKACSEGDWDENNFKVNFWYEMPLYQYASFHSGDWKDNTGTIRPIIEVVYSPMFVWKKHTICTKLSDFFNNADSTSTTYWYNNTQSDKNPIYVIYEKKMKVSELFVSDDDGKEDIMPWHYAKTAQGDNFGNPPYSKDVTNDLYDYCKDMNGVSVISKFKYKPMDYTKGKGPLKYFVEVHDGSKLTTGGGRKSEETKFDCSGNYMKENKYEQGQLKFNPETAKYVQYSSSAADVSAGAQIDPTVGSQPCLAELYDDKTKVWTDNDKIKNPLNANVGNGAEITDKFQAFGRVEITDTIKPNVGLRIADTVRGTVRRVYKINDLSTLACYKDLCSAENKQWALVDNQKHNYALVDTAKTPRAPYSLNDDSEKLWEFKDVQLLINTSTNGKVWCGNDFEGTFPDAMTDSLAPYGTAEDTKLQIIHQDLRDDPKLSNFMRYFANDNIDGQRVKKDSVQIKKEDWYKGVTALDFDSDNEKTPEFPDDYINKGYSSWLIKDDTYTDVSVFNQMYKNGNYFKYPEVCFNNPNRKWDGNVLPNGEKEISVAYGVVDQAGNKRKIKLWFYVAPLDMKIMTLEKKEKRSDGK